MNRDDVIAKMKALNLPQDSYVVFGAAPMAIANLRDVNDIDLFVTPEVLDELKQRGWKQAHKGPKDEPYQFDIYEAHPHWEFSSYAPTLKQLQKTAKIIEDIPFASLAEVRKWKIAWGRAKDMNDVELIDGYFAS